MPFHHFSIHTSHSLSIPYKLYLYPHSAVSVVSLSSRPHRRIARQRGPTDCGTTVLHKNFNFQFSIFQLSAVRCSLAAKGGHAAVFVVPYFSLQPFPPISEHFCRINNSPSASCKSKPHPDSGICGQIWKKVETDPQITPIFADRNQASPNLSESV
jgi:hypothetical protein